MAELEKKHRLGVWPEADGRCAQATHLGHTEPCLFLVTWSCLANVGIGGGTLGISSTVIAKALEVQMAEEPTMTEPQVSLAYGWLQLW